MGFISRYLASVEQGFYYTFASILALQVVFELGLSYVVMQSASHEMAKLSWTSDRKIEGDAIAKSRLRSLLVLVVKWYGVISVLIIVGIMPAGWIFFTLNQHASSVTWQVAWISLIITAAMNIFAVPIFAILEGCGHVSEIARMRLGQGVVGSLSAWLVLVSGGGLLAMPVMNAAMVIVAFLWLWFGYRAFFQSLYYTELTGNKINWKTEVFPFQWRIALSWFSGYFMLQLFVPVLFSCCSAVEAGQMGMSQSIAAAILSVSFAWVNTKAPIFGSLVASHRYLEMDMLFFRSLRQSILVALLGCGAALLGKYLLMYSGSELNNRILPMDSFFLLICTVFINNIVFAESVYLRAYKEETFMWMYVVLGLLVAISTLTVGSKFGAVGMMVCYFLISLIVSLGWGSWIFHKKRLDRKSITK